MNLVKAEKVILYVDDEVKNLTSFKAVFRKEYKIYIASTAKEGLVILEQNPIHLVIADQRMPEMTGVEFLEKVREKHPEITRMVLTGYSDFDAIMQAINKARVFQYVTKPWKKDELELVMNNALDAFELKKQNLELIQKLQKANEELDRFVYSAAHDLRGPVASLLGLINLAKSEDSLEKIRYYLALKEKTLKKLDEMIHDIIDFSKNSHLKLETNEIDFRQLIDAVVLSCRKFENADQMNVEVHIQQNQPFFSDRLRLEIIFENLISNAFRFYNPFEKKKSLSIAINADAQIVRIEIRDNGIGIDKEHLPHIFEMFYRATDKNVGSGLGLYIVKETLAKLSGTIRVSSEKEKGTTFYLDIPALPLMANTSILSTDIDFNTSL